MDENKKNVPEEEEKKPTETPPEGEPKEPEKSAEKKSDEPKNEPAKAEEKEPDGKQADEGGEGAAEKPEPVAAPDSKDEEILRLKTQIAAMQLGVKPDCMEDAVAIAESYVKAGKNDDINSALTAVIKKYPDMKSDGGDSKKQGGFKVGAGSSEKEENADSSRLASAFGLRKKK